MQGAQKKGVNTMAVFQASHLLIPLAEKLKKWAVVACDQYTSQPEYWEKVAADVGSAPSALHAILPEAQLQQSTKNTIAEIHDTMQDYCNSDLFETYDHCFVYVERVVSGGAVRRGVVGVIDLEQYDYADRSDAAIRATEKTVVERIPPRTAVRNGAALDMSHVILLADDPDDKILGMLEARKSSLPLLYQFDLMAGGGQISGWLVEKDDAVQLEAQLQEYEADMARRCQAQHCAPMAYAVGDGNHSLAAAKTCYAQLRKEKSAEELKNSPLRYALVELENIQDDVQAFEPIHRIVTMENPETLLKELKEKCCDSEGYPVKWYCNGNSGVLYLDKKQGKSAISILQNFLDSHLEDTATQLDYIHGEDVLQQLAAENNRLGFALPAISKDDFFDSLIADGVLPRKAFSVGHANEKRFYLETRKLKI